MSLPPISSEQRAIVDAIETHHVVVDAVAGSGKCHAINTPLLMYDGTIKLVQDVVVGDRLMGDDSTSRTVLSLATGYENMYTVKANIGGNDYGVNESHVLCLKLPFAVNVREERKKSGALLLSGYVVTWFDRTRLRYNSKFFTYDNENKENKYERLQAAVLFVKSLDMSPYFNISVRDYLTLPPHIQKTMKGYRVGVEFREKSIEFDPYVLGVWLGDGDSTATSISTIDETIVDYLRATFSDMHFRQAGKRDGIPFIKAGKYIIPNWIQAFLNHHDLLDNKHIPFDYKINSKPHRLKLLAGIIDTAGYYHKGYYEIVQKNKRLADDILFLCRSLGFRAQIREIVKGCSNTHNADSVSVVHRVSCSGKNLHDIPVLLDKKRALPTPSKDQLCTGIQVVPNGPGQYFGFILDGNHQYLLGDFTVTHNTTTALQIGLKYQHWKILVLTYNRKLKEESRLSVKKHKLEATMQVDSYHAFVCRHYMPGCNDDAKMNKVFKPELKPINPFHFDAIFIDEAQDSTPVYFELICKIMSDNLCKVPKLAVFGDEKQKIFAFLGADARYITMAPLLYNTSVTSTADWVELKLSTSYRITRQMAAFLNKVVLKQEKMVAVKNGPAVEYILTNVFDDSNHGVLMSTLVDVLSKYRYEDVFLLAPSVKSQNTPIRKLANRLSNSGVPIFVPNSDEDRIDDTISNGKLIASSFHQSKGLERKVVFVFGCEESWFDYFGKQYDRHQCPNEFYVAMTRSQERLFIVQSKSSSYLPFLDQNEIFNNCRFVGPDLERMRLQYLAEFPLKVPNNTNLHRNVDKSVQINVTDIIQYLPAYVMLHAQTFYQAIPVTPRHYRIIIPTKVSTGPNTFEAISDINGIAIPSYYEMKLKNTMTIMNYLKMSDGPVGVSLFEDLHIRNEHLKMIRAPLQVEDITAELLLQLTTKYFAHTSGYNFKINQLISYDWLTKDILDQCSNKIGELIGEAPEFEVRYGYEFPIMVDNGKTLIIQMTGIADCVDRKSLWEFKCVDELKAEHFIQTAIYGYLDFVQNKREQPLMCFLFNIVTGERFKILFEPKRIEEMLRYLGTKKYSNERVDQDQAFLAKSRQIVAKYGIIHDGNNNSMPTGNVQIPDGSNNVQLESELPKYIIEQSRF